MRWAAKTNDWRRCFAWLPVKIGDEWLWLESYDSMFMGEYSMVRHAQGTPTRRAETLGSVGEADGGPVAEGHAPEPCIASPNPTPKGESK